MCAGAVWFADWRRSRAVDSPAALLARLPAKDAILLSIDFAALRRAGLMDLLATSKTPEEPEYQQFVSRTDFDYRVDLDLVMAAFGPKGNYFLVKGRFDWTRLTSYAKSENGDCYNTMCRMPGSTPDRKISFFPLRPEIMALAVSKDTEAASDLRTPSSEARPIEARNDPVWIWLPASAIKQASTLPTGTQIFAKSLQDAEDVTLSLGPQGKDFQATVSVRCRTEHDAELMVLELERDTNLLRSMIARENRTPNPRDLSGVLTSGTFGHTGPRVVGHWPLARGFVADTLAGGS